MGLADYTLGGRPIPANAGQAALRGFDYTFGGIPWAWIVSVSTLYTESGSLTLAGTITANDTISFPEGSGLTSAATLLGGATVAFPETRTLSLQGTLLAVETALFVEEGTLIVLTSFLAGETFSHSLPSFPFPQPAAAVSALQGPGARSSLQGVSTTTQLQSVSTITQFSV